MAQHPSTAQMLRKLHSQFMTANQEAFAVEQYDVAYHALMAALHCVQVLKDIKSLKEIERVAHEQLAEIDTHHPEYDHSTTSAAKRGHTSIFATLARQAETWIQIQRVEMHRPTTKSLTQDPEKESSAIYALYKSKDEESPS